MTAMRKDLRIAFTDKEITPWGHSVAEAVRGFVSMESRNHGRASTSSLFGSTAHFNEVGWKCPRRVVMIRPHIPDRIAMKRRTWFIG
jgi:hypothetical protein